MTLSLLPLSCVGAAFRGPQFGPRITLRGGPHSGSLSRLAGCGNLAGFVGRGFSRDIECLAISRASAPEGLIFGFFRKLLEHLRKSYSDTKRCHSERSQEPVFFYLHLQQIPCLPRRVPSETALKRHLVNGDALTP